MLSKIILGGTASLVFVMTGCTTAPYQPYARDVKKAPGKSGVIALHLEHRDEDRAEAERKMASNCKGQEVEILEEGEAVVGQKTDSKAEKTRGTSRKEAFAIGGLSFGEDKPSEDTETSSVTTAVKEWQISYNCVAKGASNEPAAVEAEAAPAKAAPQKKAAQNKQPAATPKKK